MAKKQFLDKAGVEALVNQTKTAISTAKTEAIDAAESDATLKANAAKASAVQEVKNELNPKIEAVSLAVTTVSQQAQANAIKHADDADALMKADIAELQDAVWPLEVTFTAQPTVAKVGVATQVVLSYTAKRAGKPLDPTDSANDVTINGETHPADSGSKTLTIAAQDATAGKHNYTLVVKSGNLTKTMTAGPTFVYPSYCGTVANGWTPTADTVKALTESLQTGRGTTKSGLSMTNGKIAYAYPKSYGALTSVKDGNNFEVLGSYTRSELTIDGVEYYCYLLTNPVTATGVKQVYA